MYVCKNKEGPVQSTSKCTNSPESGDGQGGRTQQKCPGGTGTDQKFKEQQRQSRKSKWEEGTKDPWLLKDLEETETSFQTADAETARKIV